MQAIDQLSKKLDTLLRKHAALESENKKLKGTVAAQTKENEKLHKKVAGLEQAMVSVNMHTVTDTDEQENMRRQLDQVIGEIDKILQALDD